MSLFTFKDPIRFSLIDVVFLLAVTLIFSSGVFANENKDDAKVRDVLRTLENYNKRPLHINPEAADPTACKDCKTEQPQNWAYSSCAEQNKKDYVQSLIDRGNAGLNKFFAQDKLDSLTIRPACTKYILENPNISGKSVSKKCFPQEISNAEGLNCTTEPYHRLIHNSFSAVALCMKDFLSSKDSVVRYEDDLSDILGKMRIESSMHFNAVSGTGAKGSGQLTGIAIEDINQRLFGKKNSLKSYFQTHTNPQCQNLATLVEKPYQPYSNMCEKINLSDGNPAKNLIYSFAYRKILEDYNRHNFKNKYYKNKFSSDVLYEKFIKMAVTWSYNTGAGGFRLFAKTALDTMDKINNEADLERLANRITEAYSGGIVSEKACLSSTQFDRKENACYYPKIKESISEITKNAGGMSCVVNTASR